MSRLIRNEETKKIETREFLSEVLDFRERNTEVHEVYARECTFHGIPLILTQMPGQMNIFDSSVNELRENLEIPDAISDDAISDCMKENGIVLRLPMGDRYAGVPVCNIAMGAVGDRINLRGRGLYAVEETKVFEPYTPGEKAAIANIGLQHNKGKMTVLIQDETVITTRSSEYRYLPTKGVIEGFEEVLQEEGFSFEFTGGTLDRQLMIADYEIQGGNTINLARKLQGFGFDCGEVAVKAKIVTSDCGESAVRIYIMLEFDGSRQIFNSETASLIHNKGATVEKFKSRTIPSAISLISQTEKRVLNLASIQIEHAGGCLRNIAAKLHLPKEAALQVGEDMDDMYPTGCTALDVYCNLYEIIQVKQRQQGENFTPSQLLAFNEKVSKALLMDFAMSDVHFEWKD